MMRKAIYIVTGVMAAGKSSIAEALARRLDKSVHLRGDVFRRMIVNGQVDMSENPSEAALSQLEMRHDITAKAAIDYYNNGFTVIVQDNFLGDKLTYFTDLLDPCPTYVIVLNPSVRAIEQRERARQKKGYVGFTVADLHKIFLEETPRIGLWIDTTEMTIEQVVNEVEKRINNEGLIR